MRNEPPQEVDTTAAAHTTLTSSTARHGKSAEADAETCVDADADAEAAGIRAAAAILESEMANAPLVAELCERVQLSEFRLKRGFRVLFRTTVAGYLRRVRMQRAILLLQDHDLTVARVAEAVGYRNPSRFAEAFRREFGRNPHEARGHPSGSGEK